MTDVPSKHVWKIKESRIVFKDFEIMAVYQHLNARYKIKTRGAWQGPVTSPASKFTIKSCNKLRKSI